MKSEVLQIRLTKEEKSKLQEFARKNRMNMSEFLLYGAMKLITEKEYKTLGVNKLEDLNEVEKVTKENCYEIAKIKAIK